VHCDSDDKPEYVTPVFGEVPVRLIVDLGSLGNIIDEVAWERLKADRIKCTTTNKVLKQYYSYGQDKPLQLEVLFTCTLKYNGYRLENTVYLWVW